MLDIELTRPERLTAAEWRTWGDIQRDNPSLESPYFRAEFVQAVAAVRSDVEVAVLRRHRKVVGFFPFQRGPLSLGKPVGGKLSDYHGVVMQQEVALDVEALIRACGLAGWDFDHLVSEQAAFAPYVQAKAESPYLDLSQGFDAYAAERKQAGSDTVANIARKLRKFERDCGTLRFQWHDPSDAVLGKLQEWKSAQYRATGLPDVFSFSWTHDLLRQLVQQTTDDFGAAVATLYAGDCLAAVCYSMRSRGVLHAWFNTYDPRFSVHSPGLLLFERMARVAAEHGITKIDLGKGDERYKRSLATAAVPLWEGAVELKSLSVWLRGGWRRTRDWLGNSRLAEASKRPAELLKPLRSWMAYR
jgi:CelD/BcsL family acetyltransferase involved in cellulose biosynthesis